MKTQQALFAESATRPLAGRGRAIAATWVLDEETREIGRQGVAEARAILRARRRATGSSPHHDATAQSAA